MSLASAGYREVQSIVEAWTKKYQYHISLMETKPNEVKFMVEFSLAKPEKPVPIGTVRVYFTCKDDQGLKTTFRFEKDSLIHSAHKTIRHQQIQKWIDDSLAKKLLVRQTVFYLGTSYQSTRVKDARQDKILEEKVIPEEKQVVFIHSDLLADQKKVIDIMEQPHVDSKKIDDELKKHFRSIDKENIGVITHPEFITLIKNIGVKLNPSEEKDLLKKVDPQNSGMVEYLNYKTIVAQLFESLEAKKAGESNLKQKQEEEVFGSILMLINDDVQAIEDSLIAKFSAKDEDETGFTNISEAKTVLQQINKKAKDEGKPQVLNAIEMSEITKILTDNYGYKEIPYAKIHRHIVDIKIAELSQGRINSKMSKLQIHLKDLFEKYDDKKLGKIKLEDLEEGLKKSDKIKLSKTQIYLLKNIVPSDSNGNISYIEHSKFISEMIKKFYLHSSKK